MKKDELVVRLGDVAPREDDRQDIGPERWPPDALVEEAPEEVSIAFAVDVNQPGDERRRKALPTRDATSVTKDAPHSKHGRGPTWNWRETWQARMSVRRTCLSLAGEATQGHSGG